MKYVFRMQDLRLRFWLRFRLAIIPQVQSHTNHINNHRGSYIYFILYSYTSSLTYSPLLYMLYTTTDVHVPVRWPPRAQHFQPIKLYNNAAVLPKSIAPDLEVPSEKIHRIQLVSRTRTIKRPCRRCVYSKVGLARYGGKFSAAFSWKTCFNTCILRRACSLLPNFQLVTHLPAFPRGKCWARGWEQATGIEFFFIF